MKSIFRLGIIFIACNLNAQITVPVTFLPSVGDTFIFYRDSSSTIPVATSTSTFNFSTLKKEGTSTLVYKANDDLSTYPSANLKLEIDGNIANSAYFKKTSNDLLIYGMSGLGGGAGLPVAVPALNGTLKYATFPLTSTTNSTSTDKINLSLPASLLNGMINIDSILSAMSPIPGASIEVDSILIGLNITSNLKSIGYGKISTPVDNNLEVLQILRKISLNLTVGIKGTLILGPLKTPLNQDVTSLLGTQIPGGSPNFNLLSHVFYSDKYKQEIFMADIDTATNTYNNILYRYKTNSQVNSVQSVLDTKTPEIEIFLDRINIINPNRFPYNYSIVNLLGQEIQKGLAKDNTIDIKSLVKGLHFLQLDSKHTFKFSHQ